MSSLFEKLEKVGNSILAYEKHPVRELDIEFKIHYLNGLAILMRVDESIDEKEQDYLKKLLHSFDLPEEKLDEMVSFSLNPEDDAISEMLSALGESGDLKYVFIMDCLTLANADNDFHEMESRTIKKYGELLRIEAMDVEALEHLEKIVRKKDYMALHRFFLPERNFNVKIFEYLLSFYRLDIEAFQVNEKERVQALLNVDFSLVAVYSFWGAMSLVANRWYAGEAPPKSLSVRRLAEKVERLPIPEFTSGSQKMEEAINVSVHPITSAQVTIFLQEKYEQEAIINMDSKIILVDTGLLVINLDDSSIEFANGEFSFPKNTSATGLSSHGRNLFVEWARHYFDCNVDQFSLSELPATYDIDCGGLFSDQYEFRQSEYVKIGAVHYIVTLDSSKTDIYGYKKIQKIEKDYTDDHTVFRLMQF